MMSEMLAKSVALNRVQGVTCCHSFFVTTPTSFNLIWKTLGSYSDASNFVIREPSDVSPWCF